MKKPNSIQFVLSAKKMEKYIQEQVKALEISKNHPWITKDTKFKFTFTVIFKSGYFMRDLEYRGV